MAKQQQESNKCPNCKFSGNKQFPKGYCTEQLQKLDSKGNAVYKNVEISNDTQTVTASKPVLITQARCPKCGFTEVK